MGLYERHVLPRLINWGMDTEITRAERAAMVPLATGVVLEVGFGSGLNIPHYGDGVSRLYGLDPSPALKRMAMPRAEAASFPVDFVGLAAETVPLDDRSVDTVLSTWTLCTIPDVAKALGEIRRVLRPDGQLIFVEHGRAPEARVVAWQDRLNPIQRRLAGGCNLNRKIDELIAAAGFRITRIETEYLTGPKPWTYTYKGLAKPG